MGDRAEQLPALLLWIPMAVRIKQPPRQSADLLVFPELQQLIFIPAWAPRSLDRPLQVTRLLITVAMENQHSERVALVAVANNKPNHELRIKNHEEDGNQGNLYCHGFIIGHQPGLGRRSDREIPVAFRF